MNVDCSSSLEFSDVKMNLKNDENRRIDYNTMNNVLLENQKLNTPSLILNNENKEKIRNFVDDCLVLSQVDEASVNALLTKYFTVSDSPLRKEALWSAFSATKGHSEKVVLHQLLKEMALSDFLNYIARCQTPSCSELKNRLTNECRLGSRKELALLEAWSLAKKNQSYEMVDLVRSEYVHVTFNNFIIKNIIQSPIQISVE